MTSKVDIEPNAHHLESVDMAEKDTNTPRDYAGAVLTRTPAETKLPILWLMFWLNYLDRNAIAIARLNSLESDLNLKDSEYQTCVSILFVGYIFGGIPSNMLITRVRPSIYMGSVMAVWAIVSALTAVANNYIGLLLVRFFLGITEAPYYPGALYLLSIFYTRKEVATRMAVLYTGNIIATAFAGLIGAGVFHGMDGLAGLAGWRWLFILQGAVTFVVARKGSLQCTGFIRTLLAKLGKLLVLAVLKDALKDRRVWLFVFIQHMHLAANGFKNFFPTVVETLGFDTTITLVLTCPPYLIAGAISVYWSWSSGKYNERTWHITIAKGVAILGFVLGCATLNMGARYFAMIVFSVGTYAVNSIVLGWVSSTFGQTKEKRAVAISIVVSTSNISFIWTPYLWPKSDGPQYVTALASSAAFSFATLAGAWAMKFILMRQNKKIRQREGDATLFFAY
ncbi:hypothetical protein VE01_01637 [Pseudogymnoascus verrucosus]|uniref:Major facilitator superfamily (MFS) profile domain-containing protein n=1 Tax=Pseudogymnoascus verrucosus TaxID=342668 RepID=A0A1B8GWN6_9PEZI|nr:uncharacterized protein VE01_01637 [Pseudogymnoascus verrucosus]OBU00240.1 hypothetical protein VE01_01637 [Pseudogymnoascus verrucosus]